jgi:ABC-type Fe3+ transport system substrate-binding protein
LKQQNIKAYMMAGSALTQLVASGEVPASPSQFYSATHVAAKKGAPVVWVPMDINVVGAGGVAVYANAQRPHAALLFADFFLSPEGQKLLEDLYFGSAQKDYGFKRKRGDTRSIRASIGKMAQAAPGNHPEIKVASIRWTPFGNLSAGSEIAYG